MLSYDREAGMVVVKTTQPGHPDCEANESGVGCVPEQTRISLAQFLREIGISFKSVRDITSEPDPVMPHFTFQHD